MSLKDTFTKYQSYFIISASFILGIALISVLLDLWLLPAYIHDVDKIQVPDLVGKQFTEATDILTKAKLTQAQLAEKTGTQKSYISRIENGRSDIQYSTFVKIIEAGFGKRINLSIT